MLQKEEKITLTLMVMALLVLIIIYFGFIADTQDLEEYSDVSKINDRVILHGEIAQKRFTYTGDHLILNMKSNDHFIKVFICKNCGAADVDLLVDVADTVEIIGVVDEYQGEKEITVKHQKDIKVI
jgi:DNA/RNA endonuclease YhcR with UshA esterase domain